VTKPIQELIGAKVIEAFTDFARSDIADVSTLESREFQHVADAKLRTALAQVFYGSRWIYKLGLVTLATNEARAAHVRAQIVDYARLCEALVSYCIGRAIDQQHTIGTAHNYSNPDELIVAKRRTINWKPGSTDTLLRKQTFWWQARIALDFKIVSAKLRSDLDWLREERNAVHVRQRVALGATAYLKESKRAFTILTETIRQTKMWTAAHP
jgi:hypothetical protein